MKSRKFQPLLLLCACAHLSHAVAESDGFEKSEGYILGSDPATLDAWKESAHGEAMVSDELAATGLQSLKIERSSADLPITRTFVSPEDRIVFIQLSIHPATDSTESPLSILDANGAALGFIKNESKGAILAVCDPKTGQSVDANYQYDLNELGEAEDWIQLTVREDLSAKKWDLFVNGQLKLIDLPLPKFGGTQKQVSRKGIIQLYPSPAGTTYIDNLLISSENPLFPDSDKDGIPDAVEMAKGTNPNFNDRNNDSNGDGHSNIETFQNVKSLAISASGAHVIYVDGNSGDDRHSGINSYPQAGETGPKASLRAALKDADDQTIIAILPSKEAYSIPDGVGTKNSNLTFLPLGDITIKNSNP